MTDLSVHPTQAASTWLADFDNALQRQDLDAVMALFGDDCYWRDLVAFTWNIRTQEGRDAIRQMLQARLADVKPSGFQVEGQATEAGGVIDAEVAGAIDAAALAAGLVRCAAYPVLAESGGLVRTGPTGTNVADVRIVLASRSAARG